MITSVRAALVGAGWVLAVVALSGLVATIAALGRSRNDGDDFAAWTVELFGQAALLGEVSGR